MRRRATAAAAAPTRSFSQRSLRSQPPASARHSVARLQSLRRRFVFGALLLGLCCSSLLSVVSGTGGSTSQQYERRSAAASTVDPDAPVPVSELHGLSDLDATPRSLQFGSSMYVRSDLIVAGGSDLIPFASQKWYLYLVGSIFCVSLAALAAGLTIGLVSIDPFDLALIQSTEEADCSTQEEIEELREEKRYADKLMPLVQKHHLLLVTLLICNACANELLPILLDKLVPSWLAVMLSVTFVLIFGEIVPSAFFSGPQQLRLASALAPLVWCMIALMYILAYPIASILDRLLGVEDEGRLRRSELKSLIRLQAGGSSSGSNLAPSPTGEQEAAAYAHQNGVLSMDEMNILHGALEMKDKRIRDAMVPIDEVYMLSLDEILDLDMLASIIHKGHSRIPVFDGDRHNIRGVLLVKRLIVLNPEDRRLVRSIACRWPLICSPDMGLLSLMNSFQEGRSHMAIVCDKPASMMAALRAEQPVPDECNILGIITIEDIMEMLIKEEIQDESDVGVRAAMEQNELVRRRIKRLKVLAAATQTAAAAAALVSSRASSFRTLRSQSVHSRAAADAAVASLRALSSSKSTSPVLTIAQQTAASHGYQAQDQAASTVAEIGAEFKLDITSPHGITSSSSSSSSPVVMVPPSPAAGLFSPSSAAPDSTRLLRDNEFTKGARTLAPVRSHTVMDLAAFMPPPSTTAASSSSVATPVHAASTVGAGASSAAHIKPHHVRSSSILTPRAVVSSEGLHRRDLDAKTIAALKRLGSLADLQQQQAANSGSPGSKAPTRTNSGTTLAAAAAAAADADDAAEDSLLLQKGEHKV